MNEFSRDSTLECRESFTRRLHHGGSETHPVIAAGFPAAAETQGAACFDRRVAHREQNVRGGFMSAGTGRSSGDGKTKTVQFDDRSALAIGFGHDHRNRVPDTHRLRSNDLNAWNLLQQGVFELGAPLQPRVFPLAGHGRIHQRFPRGERRERFRYRRGGDPPVGRR